jgi:thermolabile hemolysin
MHEADAFDRFSRRDAASSPGAACRILLRGVLAFCVLVASAAAGPFSELVVFGDSLSDVGNVQQATEELAWLGADPTPGPYYYNGRFSDGPVYAERLALGLGLPAITRSRAGGDNFAHGGAKTTGTTGLPSFVVRDLDDQVTDFLNHRIADPNALYLVFTGANDMIENRLNYATYANRITSQMSRLVTAGARQFFVFNLPLLGETPRFYGTGSAGDFNVKTASFNSTLESNLRSLEANPALTIFRFDVAELFSEALANPAQFGLVNVHQAAAPGLAPGAESYNTALVAPNKHQYVFWDDLHPTATVHSILARHALAELSQGDFNWDGVVDGADYVMWRKEFSTSISFGDWSGHFGEIAGGSGGGSTASVGPPTPEPAMALLITVGAVFSAVFRVRRRGLVRVVSI